MNTNDYVHPSFQHCLEFGAKPDPKSGLIQLKDGHLDRFGNIYPGDGTVTYPGKTPTSILRKHPESEDNPGRVSDGTARHLRDQAEAYQRGGQYKAIVHLRSMGDRPCEITSKERNERRRLRKARKARKA